MRKKAIRHKTLIMQMNLCYLKYFSAELQRNTWNTYRMQFAFLKLGPIATSLFQISGHIEMFRHGFKTTYVTADII